MKCALLKNKKIQLTQISLLVVIKNENPLLPLLSFSSSFNNICPKKWCTAFMD
jgi:hypothetical protein